MNENDVIKALECCLGGDRTKSQVEICLPCPYFHEGNCVDLLKRNALDLINRQKAEIEVLEAEAIKEFAEKLKDRVDDPKTFGGWSVDILMDRIDNLVKEMTEGKND